MSSTVTKVNRQWNLAGHGWAVEMLRQHARLGSARHAYLITGPRGIGRRTLALRFAQALNCESPTPYGDACGNCYHCQRLEVDILKLLPSPGVDPGNGHPDLRVIEPVTTEELKDKDERAGSGGRGSRSIRIEQIRAEREKINLKPYIGKYRVLLFVRFEEATTEASNALLKTLEEAPAHAVLILTANDSESLLPTIVSRCEVLRLQPVPLQTVQHLLEERGAATEKARLLAHVSAGCPGTALRLLEDPEALADRAQRLNELLALLPATRAQRFAYAEKLYRDKVRMRDVLLLWLSFWRDVMWRAGKASTPISNIDRQAEIESLAGRLDFPQARRVVENLDQGLRQLDSNINPRLLAEILLLDWPH